jgi:hypothetical protein
VNDLLEPFRPSGRDNQPGATAGKGMGCGAADPTGCASDHDHLVIQTLRHRFCPLPAESHVFTLGRAARLSVACAPTGTGAASYACFRKSPARSRTNSPRHQISSVFNVLIQFPLDPPRFNQRGGIFWLLSEQPLGNHDCLNVGLLSCLYQRTVHKGSKSYGN